MTDDGFNIGVLYKGSRAPYRSPNGSSQRIEELAWPFQL